MVFRDLTNYIKINFDEMNESVQIGLVIKIDFGLLYQFTRPLGPFWLNSNEFMVIAITKIDSSKQIRAMTCQMN